MNHRFALDFNQLVLLQFL